MSENDNPLDAFLAVCSYPEFVQALHLDAEGVTLAITRYLAGCSPAEALTLLEATHRLSGERLSEEHVRLLIEIRDFCYAHISLVALATAEDRLIVDPKRLYAYADDGLFFIAHYAGTLACMPGATAPTLPAFDIGHREVAATVASVQAALAARGYDPPPTTDPVAQAMLGLYVMCDVLAAGDVLDVLARVRDLPPYAARCAAPIFAEDYVPGSIGYDTAHATTILTAVMVAAEDASELLQPDEPEDSE
jgi:hypothetical protein